MLVEFHHSRSLLKMPKVQEHKIVVVGPRKVGKSALVVRFLTKRFINEYVENTDMPCKRVTEVDGEPLKVHIQDTSDKAMRSSVVEQQILWADAIMMVYSITDADSFRQLKNTATKLMEKAVDLEEREQSRVPPLVLVGNKGDLDFIRQVPKREGLELAETLRCDFFEASAREGWSKLLSRSENISATCSPTTEVDTISVFAGAAASVGMVGLPHEDISREVTRCLTPTLTRRRVPISNQLSDNEEAGDKTTVKRWGSFNTLTRRNARNNHLTPHRTLAVQGFGKSGWNNSPSASEDDLDDLKLPLTRSPSRGRRSSPSTLIGKLSPRLGRKFSKTPEQKENLKITKDDNNNNNNKVKLQANSIAMGLSSSLLASAKLSETLLCTKIPRERLNSDSTTNSSTSSSDNNTSTSNSGSMENLTACNHDINSSSRTVTPTPDSSNKTLSPKHTPVVKEPQQELKIHEQDFSSSEPFYLLCRGQLNRNRIRSKSPTHKLMNGFKKIRSLAIDHGSNGQNFQKQHTIPTNGQNLLSVPIIKF